MNPLVALEIVVAVEALRTLVAFERTVCSRGRNTMGWRMGTVEMLRTSNMPTIKTWKQSGLHATHNRHGAIRTVHIRHDRTVHRRKRV